jgi:actin-related protein 5
MHIVRIPWGGSQATEYLLKSIQLKYPNFPTRVTTTQCNVCFPPYTISFPTYILSFKWILQKFCEFSPDYPSLLRTLQHPLNLRASERVIQFPFALPVVEEKTEEEIARITEKRKEQGKKLQEIAAEKRREKVGRFLYSI